MTDAPRRKPLGELLAFLASALAGLGVLRRRPAPLPEVPVVNGGEPERPAPPTSGSP
ncbi:MAG: hypothetical protein ACKN9P_05370 [Phenylobacterium sp.]